MTPRAANKRSPCDIGTATRYLEQAREFLDDARGANGKSSQVVLLVMAGINATDAICCAILREHATGSDHVAAQALLARVRPDGKALATHLGTLMRNKNKASYTVDAISAGEITKCERAAAALVRAAEEAVAVALGGTSGA
jgi:hypothetical protein